ncbi:merR regulatory family protein, partial [Vibrio cholerae CP1035(8)]
ISAIPDSGSARPSSTTCGSTVSISEPPTAVWRAVCTIECATTATILGSWYETGLVSS